MTEQSKFIARLKQQDRHGMNTTQALDQLYNSLQNVFEVYREGAGDLIRDNVFGVLAKSAQDAYEKVNVLEQRNRGLSESLKINTNRAAKLSFEFDKQAKAIGVNVDKLKQYAGELNKLIPGQTRFLANQTGLGSKIAKQLDDMRNKLGMTDEQYQKLLKNQTLFTRGNETVEKGMDDFNKIMTTAAKEYGESFEAVEATIAETVASMNSEAAARFGRMTKKSFVEAALSAKKLGIEMNTLLNIGDNFLDVESAIANEIELQALGAKELNVAEIQRAALSGDALKLEQEIEKFVKANSDLLRDNPIFLAKSAEAFGMQKDELLDINASLQLNNEAAKEAGKIAKIEGEAIDTRSEVEKRRDEANAKYAEELVKKFKTPEEMANHIEYIATTAKNAQASALKGATAIADALDNSTFVTTMVGAMKTYQTVSGVGEVIKGGNVDSSQALGQPITATSKNDLFIPASSGDTMISGPFGAFTMNPGDDILAAPNIREAAGGGTAALVAALSKMSFHVTNVFDGDKINSSLTIRQGQTLNNINNIA